MGYLNAEGQLYCAFPSVRGLLKAAKTKNCGKKFVAQSILERLSRRHSQHPNVNSTENDATLSPVEKAHRKASLMIDGGLGTFSNNGSSLFPTFGSDHIDSVGKALGRFERRHDAQQNDTL